jgi:hypothetical protein
MDNLSPTNPQNGTRCTQNEILHTKNCSTEFCQQILVNNKVKLKSSKSHSNSKIIKTKTSLNGSSSDSIQVAADKIYSNAIYLKRDGMRPLLETNINQIETYRNTDDLNSMAHSPVIQPVFERSLSPMSSLDHENCNFFDHILSLDSCNDEIEEILDSRSYLFSELDKKVAGPTLNERVFTMLKGNLLEPPLPSINHSSQHILKLFIETGQT